MSAPQCSTDVLLDAFTVDGSWLYQTKFLQPYAIGRLEALRRASGFVPRFYMTPLSSQTPLPVRDVVFMQVRMPLGTVIWGLLFWDDTASPYEVQQISETNGRSLFAEPLLPGISPGVIYLVEPFTVSASGEVNVTIANGDGPASSPVFPAQFVLLCAEPAGRKPQCP